MKVNHVVWSIAVASVLLATSGCVFKETYEAEKARSLNFQRLLAQEEKRTAELDNELKRIKRDATDYETRNRELTAQVQSAREQMARVQEETDALRDSIALQQKAQEQMKQMATPPMKRKAVEAPVSSLPKADSMLNESPLTMDTMSDTKAEVLPGASSMTTPGLLSGQTDGGGGRKAIRHEVKPGDTVYRLSRRYGVPMEKIREWNNRKDDLLEVGQRIIVGFE